MHRGSGRISCLFAHCLRGPSGLCGARHCSQGHILLLLDATGAYHRQMTRKMIRMSSGDRHLADAAAGPRLHPLILATLPETPPVSKAAALQDDLRRAGVEPFGWVINKSLAASGTPTPVAIAARYRTGADSSRPEGAGKAGIHCRLAKQTPDRVGELQTLT